jgi:hypothetical protein
MGIITCSKLPSGEGVGAAADAGGVGGRVAAGAALASARAAKTVSGLIIPPGVSSRRIHHQDTKDTKSS